MITRRSWLGISVHEWLKESDTPQGGPVAAVVEMVGALGRAAGLRLGGSRSPWRLVAVVTSGRLLSPGGPDLVVAVVDLGNTSSRLGGRADSG